VRIGISISKKRGSARIGIGDNKKRGREKNGINIKIIGIARS